jgi:hypothetical protein
VSAAPDLEALIRNRQDALRGRPLNWRDHLIDWLKRTDWSDVAFCTLMFIGLLMVSMPMITLIALAFSNLRP